MAQCVLCGQKGMLVSVDERGLCKGCQEKAKGTIDKHLETIRLANEQLHQQGVDLSTQIKDCDKILDALEQLQALERKGVKNIMRQPIDGMIQQVITSRRGLVERLIKEYYPRAKAAVDNAQTADMKIQAAEKAIQDIQRMIDTIGFSPLMAQAQNDFRKMTYQAEFRKHISKAETAEKCSLLEDAYEEYKKALEFLKKLELDPENPSPHLVHLQNKIETVMVMVENAKPRRDY